jgi:hypothetical protein
MTLGVKLFALLVFLAGCAPSEREKLAKTFEKLPTLSQHVAAAEKLTVYEGLPRPDGERGQFEKELATAKTIAIDGHRFYPTPVTIDADTLGALRGLCTNHALYKSIDPTAAKACGSFHPDWCLAWTRGMSVLNVHFCFLCGEIKAFADGDLLVLCEVRDRDDVFPTLNRLRLDRTQD